MECNFVPLDKWTIQVRGPYKILIADNPCKRIQGLRGISFLPENVLMLIPRIKPKTYFHTKNCLFTIDIDPISRVGEVLAIYTVEPEINFIGPMPYLTSKVLEAPANWFKEKGINVGDFVPLLNI